MNVSFVMAAGSNYITPTPNAWASGNFLTTSDSINGVAAAGDSFQITGLIILPGLELPNAAQSPYIMRSYPLELLICKRYFYNGAPSMHGLLASPTVISRMSGTHPVTMRAAPTVTLVSPLQVIDQSGTSTMTSISLNFSTVDVLEINGGTSTSLSPLSYVKTYQGSGSINVDARL